MSFLEAIKAIEKRVEGIHIRLKDGTPIAPVVALGRIGRYHGARYDFVIEELYEGRERVEWYYTEMIKMIMGYEKRPERMGEDLGYVSLR